ncbi:MAG: hypothetical protein WBV78_16220, partial [Roseobacter sp.]
MEREHQALGSARLARAIEQGATSTLERNAGIRSKPALCLGCEEYVQKPLCFRRMMVWFPYSMRRLFMTQVIAGLDRQQTMVLAE